MPKGEDKKDPLEGAQYGPKEPRSRAQRLLDTVADADYVGTMQSLGPTGYGLGGLASVTDKASKTAKAASKYAKGGGVGKAASRADGCARKGKTKGRML